MNAVPKAPKHLRSTTKAWWLEVCQQYELRDHHRMLLTLAAEAYDELLKRVRSWQRMASSSVRLACGRILVLPSSAMRVWRLLVLSPSSVLMKLISR